MISRQDNGGPYRLTVMWNHIDGPMMHRRDGTLYWLRWRDRFMHAIGRWSLLEIERRSYFTRWGR